MINFKGPLTHKYTESPVLKPKLDIWRSRFIGTIMLGLFVLWGGRAFYLQVLHNDFLQEKGDSRYRRDLEISASRGNISDRNGEVLAISTPMKSIWAVPGEARLSADETRQLAALLNIEIKELNRKLASERSFVYLQRQVPPDLAEKIAALKLPGIGQDKEYRRYYPSGEMTAHIVGFTGVDDKGLEGVELAFQNQLHGRPGMRTVIKDRKGQIVEDVGSIRPPQDGQDIALSIDSKIQYLAYSHLKQAVIDNKAKAGGIIVADVQTGEILALVNWPTYNPNNREHLSGAQLRNRAVTDTFEPGSTLKPFTAALALDKGKFRFDSLINCAPGRMTIGTATISDSHPHGVLSVAQVVQKSSNIGMAKIAAQLAPQEMWEMFETVGFGQLPKLGFPGEVSGRLRSWKSWRPIEQATMAYGYGISVSLIQLVRGYIAFARDGEIIPLSLTKIENPVIKGTRVFSPQTSQEIKTMLEMAVLPGGTAPKARVPGYRVAGKTGTALKLSGKQYEKKYVASFAGFAPLPNPRLVVAVMLDEPSAGRIYGGDVAGPTFSAVMGSALRNLGVPQDPATQVAQNNNEKKG